MEADVCKTTCIYKDTCDKTGADKQYCLIRYLTLEVKDYAKRKRTK